MGTLYERKAIGLEFVDDDDGEAEDGLGTDQFFAEEYEAVDKRNDWLQQVKSEKLYVKLQMEAFGLTETLLVDGEQEAIQRARDREGRSCKGRTLAFITSKPFQVCSFLLIFLNLIVMKFEVDAHSNSVEQKLWQDVQYAITCLFAVEAGLNLFVY